MKKIVVVGICMLLSMCICLSASAVTTEPLQTNTQVTIESLLVKISNKQRDAIAANELFQSNMPVSDDGELVYPNTFAGNFIDDEGNLIIQVSSDDFSDYQYLQDSYPCVKLNQVEYSKDYLKRVLDECLETYDENADTFYRAYIDVELNRAVIEVDEQTLSFRSTNDDSSPLVFKLGSPTYVCLTDITSGDLLTNKRSNSISDLFNHINFSAGIGMKTSLGQDAIAACGHGMKVNDKIYLGNTHIGTVTYVSYSNYAKGDYSIITLNENGSSTYDLYGRLSNHDSGKYQISQNMGTYAPCKGEYVFKCTTNSGVAAFVIEGLDMRIYAYDLNDSSASPVIIDGQTSAGLMSAGIMGILGETVKPGDSGSGVFYYSDGQGSLKIGDYFCGIISTYNTDTLSLSFTPASRIQSHGTIKISIPKGPFG